MKFLVNRIEQSKKDFYDTWDSTFENLAKIITVELKAKKYKETCYSDLLVGKEVIVNKISFQIDFEEELIENDKYLKSFS